MTKNEIFAYAIALIAIVTAYMHWRNERRWRKESEKWKETADECLKAAERWEQASGQWQQAAGQWKETARKAAAQAGVDL